MQKKPTKQSNQVREQVLLSGSRTLKRVKVTPGDPRDLIELKKKIQSSAGTSLTLGESYRKRVKVTLGDPRDLIELKKKNPIKCGNKSHSRGVLP